MKIHNQAQLQDLDHQLIKRVASPARFTDPTDDALRKWHILNGRVQDLNNELYTLGRDLVESRKRGSGDANAIAP